MPTFSTHSSKARQAKRILLTTSKTSMNDIVRFDFPLLFISFSLLHAAQDIFHCLLFLSRIFCFDPVVFGWFLQPLVFALGWLCVWFFVCWLRAGLIASVFLCPLDHWIISSGAYVLFWTVILLNSFFHYFLIMQSIEFITPTATISTWLYCGRDGGRERGRLFFSCY